MKSSSSGRFFLIVSGLLLTSFLAGCTQSSWPPLAQEMSSEAPVLTPEQALDSFYLPPGYEVELDVWPEGLLTAASSTNTELRRRAQSLLERLKWQASARADPTGTS